jgi:alcohol dehydrogenase
MNDFQFSVPQMILFGENKVNALHEITKKEKMKKILLISDRMLEKIGVVEKVINIFRNTNIQVNTFLDVEANPSVETVNKAVEVCKKEGADGIVALGGGSPMDVAKAVAVLATYGGDITDYEGAHQVPGPIMPVIAIPTTAGTGSEVTAFSVITDIKRNYKLTVFSYELIPSYAILDPQLICSLPQNVAASTGIDALVHAVEAYLSKAASPFSDAMAEKAITLIGENIQAFAKDRTNLEAASAMLYGSTFAGIAFAWARLGNVHAMAHPLGGFFNVPHGVANAILLPTVLEYNAVEDQGRYSEIYRLMTGKTSDCFEPLMLVKYIKTLLVDLNIPQNLASVGVKPEMIPQMSMDAMKSGNILVNPRSSTVEDIQMLYEKAM